MYVRVTQKKKKKKSVIVSPPGQWSKIKEKMMENVNTIFQSFIFILFSCLFVCLFQFIVVSHPRKLTKKKKKKNNLSKRSLFH